MASQETIDKAVNEYGINNAAEMSDKQLKAEMKAIDDQPKTAENEDTVKEVPAKTETDDKETEKASDKEKSTSRRRLFGRKNK